MKRGVLWNQQKIQRGGVGFKPINCPSGGVVIFWSNTLDKSQKYRAVHWRVSSVTQTNKEVVVPKIIEYSVINRTQKGRLWAISQFYGTMKIMQQTDRQRKWIQNSLCSTQEGTYLQSSLHQSFSVWSTYSVCTIYMLK